MMSFVSPAVQNTLIIIESKVSTYHVVSGTKQKNITSPHRLSINRPTKRGKEKSPSDGHCQCEKEMDDDLLECQQILVREPHSDTPC
jgi:hypothetical protein